MVNKLKIIFGLSVLIGFTGLFWLHYFLVYADTNKPISQELFNCLERKIVQENIYDAYQTNSFYYPESGEYGFRPQLKKVTLKECQKEVGE